MRLTLRTFVPESMTETLAVGAHSTNADSGQNSSRAQRPGTACHLVKLAREAWAAGFSSATRDGSDLLGGTPDAAKDAQQAAATFYSRTAVWMGSLRVPAGMYRLIPSKSPDGWSLAVARQDGEWNDAKTAQQYLGSVAMKRSASDNPTGQYLTIATRRWAEGCPGPSPRPQCS